MARILLLTLEYPPQKGGIARYLYNAYSARSRDELVILAPHSESEKVFDNKQSHKIYRRNMSVWWAWPRWRIIGWHIISIWFRERFSEIHISHVLPVGYIALVFWKIFRIPYRVYTHGMDILLPQKSIWKKFWLKIILRNARELVANSNFTKNEILKLGIAAKKVTVLYPCVLAPKLFSYSHLSAESAGAIEPNGPPLSVEDAAGREADESVNYIKKQYNLEEKKIILSVGRLVQRKGFDNVIEAMLKILSAVPETVYAIVGNGPDKRRLEQIARSARLLNRVIFVGEARDEELDAWYNLCDVFVMSARQIGADVEGFGIVFLEAGLRCKPSIGGRSGGIPEVIEDGKTGILVDPDNLDELAKNLIRLLKNDELRTRLGDAAKKRAQEKFLCK